MAYELYYCHPYRCEIVDSDCFKSEHCDRYLEYRGQGDTMATQASAALNKLIYKFYNDGDVFDWTYHKPTWNDLSSYANWLYTYIPETRGILKKAVKDGATDTDYSIALYELYELIFENHDMLDELNMHPAVGDIYNQEGVFECVEIEDEWDEWDDDEDDEW